MEDELRNLWQDQPVEPVKMSIEDIRRKAQAFETKVGRGYRIAWVILIFCLIGYASFFFIFTNPVQRAGSCLTVAGYLVGAYQLRKRGPARRVPENPAEATCAAYRGELERQREFHLSVFSRLLVFVPGPVVFIMGFVGADLGTGQAIALATALVLPVFLLGVPLSRREARKLQGEIAALDAARR